MTKLHWKEHLERDVIVNAMKKTRQQRKNKKLDEAVSEVLQEVATKSVREIVEEIASNGLDPKELRADQRRECVEFLLLGGKGATEIGRILSVDRATVYRNRERIETLRAGEIRKLDISRVAALCKAKSEHLYRKALDCGENRLAWQITKESVDLLQSLGFVYRRGDTIELSFEDLRKLGIRLGTVLKRYVPKEHRKAALDRHSSYQLGKDLFRSPQ